MTDLTELGNKKGQTRFIAGRRPLVDQILASRLIYKRDSSLILLRGFVFARFGAELFDRLTKLGPGTTIAKAFGLRCFHALGAGLMIRQFIPFLNTNNRSASKYNRQIYFVNH